MKRIPVDADAPLEATVSEAVTMLRRGGVIAFPTETFYGLGVDALDRRACERVYAVKGREGTKPLPWIVSDVEQLAEWARVSDVARRLGERFWPGPLTLIVPLKRGEGTAAVRVSGLALPRALAAGLGRPITSTSANASGAPPPVTAEPVGALPGIDLVLDGGPTPGGAPSTIVDVSVSGRVELVRAGAVAYETVAQVLAESSLIG